MQMHKGVPNADKKIKKLLIELLQIYMQVFDSNSFCEDKQIITNKEIIPIAKDKLKKLRVSELEKLTKKEIFFDQLLDCEDAKKETDNIKRCFWLNLVNFKLLQKILEIFLV